MNPLINKVIRDNDLSNNEQALEFIINQLPNLILPIDINMLKIKDVYPNIVPDIKPLYEAVILELRSITADIIYKKNEKETVLSIITDWVNRRDDAYIRHDDRVNEYFKTSPHQFPFQIACDEAGINPYDLLSY